MAKATTGRIVTADKLGIRLEFAGNEAIGVAIDGTKLDAPTNTYTATWVHAIEDPDNFQLLFGQVLPLTKRLSTMLSIVYGREPYVQQDWRTRNNDFREKLRGFVGGIPEHGTFEDDALSDTKFHTERATFEVMAHAGDNAEIDFYYLSPTEFNRAKKSNQIRKEMVRPVASVVLSARLLLALLDEVDAILTKKGGNNG